MKTIESLFNDQDFLLRKEKIETAIESNVNFNLLTSLLMLIPLGISALNSLATNDAKQIIGPLFLFTACFMYFIVLMDNYVFNVPKKVFSFHSKIKKVFPFYKKQSEQLDISYFVQLVKERSSEIVDYLNSFSNKVQLDKEDNAQVELLKNFKRNICVLEEKKTLESDVWLLNALFILLNDYKKLSIIDKQNRTEPEKYNEINASNPFAQHYKKLL